MKLIGKEQYIAPGDHHYSGWVAYGVLYVDAGHKALGLCVDRFPTINVEQAAISIKTAACMLLRRGE